MQKRLQYRALRRACRINDMIFSEIINDFHFQTEHELALYIRKRFRDFGVKPAYPPIVANNCMKIHPKPRKKKLERGFLLLDFGCKVHGWCSDMTRTIFLGTATKKERKLYALVKRCQERCIRKARVGMMGCDLDLYARHLLGDHKPFLKHAVGHGVSKKIHDMPRISVTSPDRINRGDFITIEPGIYFKHKGKEVGIRIEDTLHMGKTVEVLCKASKHFLGVPFG